MGYDLARVATENDWRSYHLIRRTVLWDARGRQGYDRNHPDDRRASNHPLLLTLDRQAIGTIRLDDLGDRTGAVRLVSIVADRQRQGHGRVLSALADSYAVRLGWVRLMVNAALEAVGFYESMGWCPFDWDQAELAASAVPCIQMTKVLPPVGQPHTMSTTGGAGGGP